MRFCEEGGVLFKICLKAEPAKNWRRSKTDRLCNTGGRYTQIVRECPPPSSQFKVPKSPTDPLTWRLVICFSLTKILADKKGGGIQFYIDWCTLQGGWFKL